jgi:hypothetical protein
MGQDGFQNRVVNRREELLDIALEHAAVAAHEVRAAIQRGMGALPFSVGVAVADEFPLVDRLDDVAQGVVHHTVAKRGALILLLFGSFT